MERLLADEYEIKHFGFSSTDFIAQFGESINSTIQTIHNDLENCIGRKLQLNNEEKGQLHQEMCTLTELYTEKTKETLKEHEADIRDFFTIPQNVVLTDNNIHIEMLNVDLEELLNDINKLEKQYEKEKTLIVLYDDELKKFEKISLVQKEVSKLLDNADKIHDISVMAKDITKLRDYRDKLVKRVETDLGANTSVLQNEHREKFAEETEIVPL